MEHSADDSQSILSVLVLLIKIEPNPQTRHECYQGLNARVSTS
jgi:hypothetical protein